MSEQRGVRGGSSDGSNDPEDTDATESEAAGSKADLSKADTPVADSSESAPSARPTGKRRARAPRAESTDDSSGKGVATATRIANRSRSEAAPKQNVFKRLRKFFREVVAELRKVIWPNRKQMVTYTVVVVVFVTFMVAYISGLDLAFIKGITWLFG